MCYPCLLTGQIESGKERHAMGGMFLKRQHSSFVLPFSF